MYVYIHLLYIRNAIFKETYIGRYRCANGKSVIFSIEWKNTLSFTLALVFFRGNRRNYSKLGQSELHLFTNYDFAKKEWINLTISFLAYYKLYKSELITRKRQLHESRKAVFSDSEVASVPRTNYYEQSIVPREPTKTEAPRRIRGRKAQASF